MEWNITKVDISYSIGRAKSCIFEAVFTDESDMAEIHDLMKKNEEIPVIEAFVGNSLYKFKKCYVQQFGYQERLDGDAFVNLKMACDDVEVLDSIKIEFKDKKEVVKVSDYLDVKNHYGKPEGFSLEEFESRALALKI